MGHAQGSRWRGQRQVDDEDLATTVCACVKKCGHTCGEGAMNTEGYGVTLAARC
jgi:hypothetical protein